MLNKKFLSRYSFYKASLAFIFCALLINLNCGKRQPPQPPVERIVQRAEVSGFQRGNIITLSLSLPVQNASEASVLNIARADVYRLPEAIDSPRTLSEEEFASRSTLISSVKITVEDFKRGQLTFTDTLQFAGQNSRLRYAVRFVNAAGQKAAFSNFLLIEPTAKVASSPTALSGKISEEAIALGWNAPDENVDGSKPANVIGYNIYRIADGDEAAKIINNTPLTGSNFKDELFEFGRDYQYFVRAISLGGNGEPVESADSNVIRLNPKDVFAPGSPSAVTIAAAPNNLSIFFAVNPEKDIAGYRIYRSTERDQPLSEWNLLTDVLLTTNTFQDTAVKSGETYFYYLNAVDTVGNVSQPSEIVSETAP